jgi:hypothetical protein
MVKPNQKPVSEIREEKRRVKMQKIHNDRGKVLKELKEDKFKNVRAAAKIDADAAAAKIRRKKLTEAKKKEAAAERKKIAAAKKEALAEKRKVAAVKKIATAKAAAERKKAAAERKKVAAAKKEAVAERKKVAAAKKEAAAKKRKAAADAAYKRLAVKKAAMDERNKVAAAKKKASAEKKAAKSVKKAAAAKLKELKMRPDYKDIAIRYDFLKTLLKEMRFLSTEQKNDQIKRAKKSIRDELNEPDRFIEDYAEDHVLVGSFIYKLIDDHPKKMSGRPIKDILAYILKKYNKDAYLNFESFKYNLEDYNDKVIASGFSRLDHDPRAREEDLDLQLNKILPK